MEAIKNTFFSSTKRIITTLLLLVIVVAIPVAVYLLKQQQELRKQAFIFPTATSITSPDGKTTIDIATTGEHLDDKGRYTVSFSFTKRPNNETTPVEFLIGAERDRCAEGNGQDGSKSIRYDQTQYVGTPCFTPWEDDEVHLIILNQENNFTQTLSVTTTQVGGVSCGSFQTDILVLAMNGQELNIPGHLSRYSGYEISYQGKIYPNAKIVAAGGNYNTGKDLASCAVPNPTPTPPPTATPSATPKVTPSPTPVPSVTPSPTPTTPPPPPPPPPAPQSCGYTPCSNDTQCNTGLKCVQTSKGGYCAMPEFEQTCKDNPSVGGCCTRPTPTPPIVQTTPKPTLPVAGGVTTSTALSIGGAALVFLGALALLLL